VWRVWFRVSNIEVIKIGLDIIIHYGYTGYMKTQTNVGNTWKLYTAKNQLSSIIERTATAPQTITVRGREKAVIISSDDYRKLKKPKKNIVDCLSGYLTDDDVHIFERDISKVERGTPIAQLD
jgi:prevent-host-death family protein